MRRIGARANTHWRVKTAAGETLVLRRYADGPYADASAAWEHRLTGDLAAFGQPAPAALAAPQRIGGDLWLLMRHLPGRKLGAASASDDGYRWLGRELARLHDDLERLAPRPQRPGWGAFIDAALPVEGGAALRRERLADLERAAPDAHRRLRAALDAFEARDLPAVFAAAPRLAIHGDCSPWNVLRRGGEVSGLLDFEMSHLDVAAADLAMSRRGYHDAVVEGYLSVRTMPAAQLAALDALWTGSLLFGLWRILAEWRREGRARPADLAWRLEQLAKVRPYRPR